MKRLRAWLELSWSERWLLLRLALALPLVAGLLRAAGYVRSRRWLEAASNIKNVRDGSEADLQQAQRLAQLTGLIGRHGAVTATCLRQSLLVYWWLRRQGLAPELKIGVRKQGQVFDAHSWVELRGQPLAQPSLHHVAFPDSP